jgi:hypothetical protein
MSTKIDIVNEEIQKLISYNFDEKEPEFDSIKTDKPLLVIWKSVDLKLQKIAESNHGTFADSDSYLILNIKSPEEKYAHIWTGRKSSKEKISYISFKVLQLDHKLENNCVILYESERNESELFKSYFKFFTVLRDRIEEIHKSLDDQQYKARLFHVHSSGANIHSRQISINKKNIDTGDVYMLDTGVKVFIYIGKGSNSFEKFHLSCMVEKIKEVRQNKAIIISIDESCELNEHDLKNKNEFEEFLQKFEENIQETDEQNKIDKNYRKMMKLSDENGKLELTDVEYKKENLVSQDSFLIDRGDAIIIWIGKEASKKEKKFAKFYANKYISKENRNGLSVIIVNEGKLSSELDKCFK